MAVSQKNKNTKVKKEEKKEEVVVEEPKTEPQPKKRGVLFRIFKILMIVILFFALIGGGFAVGVYLNFFTGSDCDADNIHIISNIFHVHKLAVNTDKSVIVDTDGVVIVVDVHLISPS